MITRNYIAVDLGASNGRTILGKFDGEKITLQELNRFSNNYSNIDNAYYWDILNLLSKIKEGICQYGINNTEPLSGIGIDTWGVDFGLLDKDGKLVGNPRGYRDARGLRGMKAFRKKYGDKTAFEISGVFNQEFNTIYQLYDMVVQEDPQLKIADKLLLMPDLLGYFLTGNISSEYTNLTTTQMYDRKSENWSEELINMIGVDKTLFTKIQMPGELKGKLKKSIADEARLENIPDVFCVGSHDTASAISSIPAIDSNYAFISSGTWSLIGITSNEALVNEYVYENKFSNEGAVDGKYSPLKNIMGIWVLQNCKKKWEKESNEKYTWDEIMNSAVDAPPFSAFIDINYSEFFTAENMPEKIQKYCEVTGQYVPQTRGEIARVVYEGLALSYKYAFDGLEQLKGSRINKLHIVGGGSKNLFLNQLTANAINRDVVTGPIEATAIGSILTQAIATGDIKDSNEMKQIIKNSFDVDIYKPTETDIWADKYIEYLKILKIN